MTDMLDSHQCSKHTINTVPGKPHVAMLLESEFLLKLPSVCQSVINLFWISSLFTVSFPLGKEDHFYVTASWRAEGLGPVCLVVMSLNVSECVCACACCYPPVLMLQRSNVAKALINTLWEPWRESTCQVVHRSSRTQTYTHTLGAPWPFCQMCCIKSTM